MAASNYDACLAKTLSYEGGYSNNPSDPGGPTNWGITIADARRYWRADATAADVRVMPLSVAKEIYKQRYWNAVNGDTLAAGVDLATFDFGVNSGVARARQYLFAVLGGPPVDTVKRLCAKRAAFLHVLRTWALFGKGWGRRVADVETTGVKMALQAAGANPEDVKKRLEKEAKEAAAKRDVQAGGTVVVGIPAPAVDWSLIPTLGKAAAAAIIIAALVWAAWHIWQNHQRASAYAAAASTLGG